MGLDMTHIPIVRMQNCKGLATAFLAAVAIGSMVCIGLLIRLALNYLAGIAGDVSAFLIALLFFVSATVALWRILRRIF